MLERPCRFPAPLLMCVYDVTSIQSKPSEIVHCFFRLSRDHENNDKFIRMGPKLYLQEMLWSSSGWFLVRDSSHQNFNRCLLINPFADKRVDLPSCTSSLNISDFTLSSPPTSQDWVIVLKTEYQSSQLNSDMNEVKLLAYKADGDHWSSLILCKGINTNSMAFYKGRLYALCLYSRDCLIFKFDPNIKSAGAVPFPPNHFGMVISKLVESDEGELMLIVIGERQDKRWTVTVYKIDDEIGNQWVVVNDLGDRAIVLDEHRAICFSVTDETRIGGGCCSVRNENLMERGFKRNCIYFFLSGCGRLFRCSMEDDRIHESERPSYGYNFKWIMPSL